MKRVVNCLVNKILAKKYKNNSWTWFCIIVHSVNNNHNFHHAKMYYLIKIIKTIAFQQEISFHILLTLKIHLNHRKYENMTKNLKSQLLHNRSNTSPYQARTKTIFSLIFSHQMHCFCFLLCATWKSHHQTQI